ncbi:MAG TPA: NINE protein [Candidatus Angelobacter sp.]|jgi:TM2 domain-containing membrane protein YozV
MTSAVCPYCRCPVEAAEREAIVCTGCGTPHHSDCYMENGGCTVFGCSAAPEEEAKLSVSGADLTAPDFFPGTQAQSIPAVRPAPPPPVNGAAIATQTVAPQYNAGSILFRPTPVVPSRLATAAAPAYVDFMPHPDAKDKNRFILLGAFLGMFGAHSFYAGYKRKAFIQLGITVLTLGFAIPMVWVWAIIDVCTIEEDSNGTKFRS